jgi:hypothetical protein
LGLFVPVLKRKINLVIWLLPDSTRKSANEGFLRWNWIKTAASKMLGKYQSFWVIWCFIWTCQIDILHTWDVSY